MFHTAPKSTLRRSIFSRLLTFFALLLCISVADGCKANDKQVIAQADQAHGELDKAVVKDPQGALFSIIAMRPAAA